MRFTARIVLAVAVITTLPSVAQASSAQSSGGPQPVRAADGLSTPVTFTGSGDTARVVRTDALRKLVPAASPRILMIGTGVARSLLPPATAAMVSGLGAPADLTDVHGYGTVAATTILQLSPGARVTSRAIRSADAAYHLIDLASLASALEGAYTRRADHDAVLLAFPPNGALEPLAHLIGHTDRRYGAGDALLAEALLATPARAQTRGIPLDPALRAQVFARANQRQRDAVERYAQRVVLWNRVTLAIRRLADAGVAIVAPAGDFTRTARDGTLVPLPHQTIYGVAAMPEVITVGAAYTDSPALGTLRISPTSGRGPTLSLGMKPDVVAPADIVTLLPAAATLAWPDDSLRIPPALVTWARPGVAPSACPSPSRTYRCSLQASSMVAAALVATNLAASVNRGVPRAANARTSIDDDVLRGLTYAAATTVARSHPGSPMPLPPDGAKTLPAVDRDATVFEQGAGVVQGLAGFDPHRLPIALAPAHLGELGFTGPATRTSIPLWTEGATTAASPVIAHRLVADESGRAILEEASASFVSASTALHSVTLSADPGARTGGLYAGLVQLTSPDGGVSRVPLAVVQDLPFRFHADYAYNEFMHRDGREGERVEDASVVLMAGLPDGVGLVGEGFKNLGGVAQRRVGGDPLHNLIVRSGRARSQFRDPSLPAREHGRGAIDAVPPGFYRFHLLTDHSVEASQPDGTPESLGIGLGSFGPDGFSSPSHAILVPSDPPCAEAASQSCTVRNPTTTEVDERTGFCVARNDAASVRFGVYCGEVAYAVPSAIVTRAVHLVDRAEWQPCTVSLESDGSVTSITDLLAETDGCDEDGSSALPSALPGSAWEVSSGSASCLAPSERAMFPNGHPSDLTASFSPIPQLAAERVPALVLRTEVPLPYLNTYTTATLTLAYEASDAVIVTRFDAGPSPAADASHAILSLTANGTVPGARPRGTYLNEWSVMSSNAPRARLSIIAFPTSATSQARVSLCDVALRVSTFAKQTWGPSVSDDLAIAGGAPVRSFPILDRGISAMIDPARSRARARFSPSSSSSSSGSSPGGSFSDAAVQRESAILAVHSPRNTTVSPAAPNRVRSPWGGPATPLGPRRWGSDALRHESLPSAGVFDGARGTTSLACTDQTPMCVAWRSARANNTLLEELAPDLMVNGRFHTVTVIDEIGLRAGAGNVAFDTALGRDDGGAFASTWSSEPRIPVSLFPTHASETPTATPLDPVVQVFRDASGHAVVVLRGTLPGGAPSAISAPIV